MKKKKRAKTNRMKKVDGLKVGHLEKREKMCGDGIKDRKTSIDLKLFQTLLEVE